MNHEEIELKNLNKNFEFAKFSSELENIDDVETLKKLTKMYYKLYLKQQEVLCEYGFNK